MTGLRRHGFSRAERWREFPPLRRESPPSDALSRRHPNHGRSRQPQTQNRASAYPPREFRISAALVNPEPILGIVRPSLQLRLRATDFYRYSPLELGRQTTQVIRKLCEQLSLFLVSCQIADQFALGCIGAELFQLLLQVFHRYARGAAIQTN